MATNGKSNFEKTTRCSSIQSLIVSNTNASNFRKIDAIDNRNREELARQNIGENTRKPLTDNSRRNNVGRCKNRKMQTKQISSLCPLNGYSTLNENFDSKKEV